MRASSALASDAPSSPHKLVGESIVTSSIALFGETPLQVQAPWAVHKQGHVAVSALNFQPLNRAEPGKPIRDTMTSAMRTEQGLPACDQLGLPAGPGEATAFDAGSASTAGAGSVGCRVGSKVARPGSALAVLAPLSDGVAASSTDPSSPLTVVQAPRAPKSLPPVRRREPGHVVRPHGVTAKDRLEPLPQADRPAAMFWRWWLQWKKENLQSPQADLASPDTRLGKVAALRESRPKGLVEPEGGRRVDLHTQKVLKKEEEQEDAMQTFQGT